MHKGIMGLANGGDPDEKLRAWQGRRKRGTGGRQQAAISTQTLMREAQQKANRDMAIRSLLERLGTEHGIHGEDDTLRALIDIFDAEVPGYPAPNAGEAGRLMNNPLRQAGANQTLRELLGLERGDVLKAQNTGMQSLLPEGAYEAYWDARQAEEARLTQSRQNRETKKQRQKARGEASGSKLLVDEADSRAPRRRSTRRAAGPGMPSDVPEAVETVTRRTAAGPGAPSQEGRRKQKRRKAKGRFVSPDFDPITGDYRPGAHSGYSFAGEQVLKEKIEDPLKGADAATQSRVARGLEAEFTGMLEEDARKVVDAGGRVTPGHAAPEYIFNRRAVSIDDVPAGKKIKDWLDYLRNNTGRGRVTPDAVQKVVGNLMKRGGAAILGLLGSPLMDVAEFGLMAEEMGSGDVPEASMTPAEREAMTSYYEDLMAPDLGMLSPDINFEGLFGDQPTLDPSAPSIRSRRPR